MIVHFRTRHRLIPLTLTKVSDKKIKVKFNYFKELVEEVKSWEGASWNPETKEWTVDDSEHNHYCIHSLTEGNPRYDAPLFYNFGEKKRQAFDHQWEMVQHALQRRRVIWACEPGTGKTLAAIEVMERSPDHYWIVVPKTAWWVWENEFKKWKSSIVPFSQDWLRNKKGSAYTLVSRDRLFDLLTRVPKEFLPGSLIVDECHGFRNPNARRTEAMLTLASIVRNKEGIIILMSGTCAPKDPTDWWTYVRACQPGFLREGTKNKLKFRMGHFEDAGEYKKLVFWKRTEVENLYQRLKGMVLIKKKKDCLDLPDKIYQEIIIPCEKSHKGLINFIKLTSSSGLETLIRLRKLSDGFNDDTIIETPKDIWLREFLETEERNRIVLWGGFHKTIDKLVLIARESGYQTIKLDGRGLESTLDNPLAVFQSPDPQKIAFIGHPEAGGVSITLTESDTEIYYSNSFKSDARSQSEDRIHRISSKGARIIDLLWLPTDKLVLDNLKRKKNIEQCTLGEIEECWDKYWETVGQEEDISSPVTILSNDLIESIDPDEIPF